MNEVVLTSWPHLTTIYWSVCLCLDWLFLRQGGGLSKLPWFFSLACCSPLAPYEVTHEWRGCCWACVALLQTSRCFPFWHGLGALPLSFWPRCLPNVNLRAVLAPQCVHPSWLCVGWQAILPSLHEYPFLCWLCITVLMSKGNKILATTSLTPRT